MVIINIIQQLLFNSQENFEKSLNRYMTIIDTVLIEKIEMMHIFFNKPEINSPVYLPYS